MTVVLLAFLAIALTGVLSARRIGVLPGWKFPSSTSARSSSAGELAAPPGMEQLPNVEYYVYETETVFRTLSGLAVRVQTVAETQRRILRYQERRLGGVRETLGSLASALDQMHRHLTAATAALEKLTGAAEGVLITEPRSEDEAVGDIEDALLEWSAALLNLTALIDRLAFTTARLSERAETEAGGFGSLGRNFRELTGDVRSTVASLDEWTGAIRDVCQQLQRRLEAWTESRLLQPQTTILFESALSRSEVRLLEETSRELENSSLRLHGLSSELNFFNDVIETILLDGDHVLRESAAISAICIEMAANASRVLRWGEKLQAPPPAGSQPEPNRGDV